MRKLALALALLLATPAAMGADRTPLYWGLSAGSMELDPVDIIVATATLGYQIIPHIGIEGRIGSTLVRDDYELFDENHKVGIDFFSSAFVRLNLLTDDVRPYVLLGGTYGKASASGPYAGGSEEESDFSFGGGIALYVNNIGVQLEYIRYIDKKDIELDGFNLGVIAHF